MYNLKFENINEVQKNDIFNFWRTNSKMFSTVSIKVDKHNDNDNDTNTDADDNNNSNDDDNDNDNDNDNGNDNENDCLSNFVDINTIDQNNNDTVRLPIKIYFNVVLQYFTIKFILDLLELNHISYKIVSSIKYCDVYFIHPKNIESLYAEDYNILDDCICKLIIYVIPYKNSGDVILDYIPKDYVDKMKANCCTGVRVKCMQYYYSTDTKITDKHTLISNKLIIMTLIKLQKLLLEEMVSI